MTSLAYRRSGAGEPLVLLHALGSSREAWDPVGPALARHAHRRPARLRPPSDGRRSRRGHRADHPLRRPVRGRRRAGLPPAIGVLNWVGERVTVPALAGIALVLAGVALTRRRAAAKAAADRPVQAG